MILNSHEYNPLPVIFGVLPTNLQDITAEILSLIQSELFKAGIVPETIQEFDTVLGLLKELMIKEYYGKK
jgi:hypothetical protein